ncbi:MAG: GTPase [archaeon]
MSLKHLEKPQVLIDAAFNRGRKNSSLYPQQKTSFYTIKGKEMAFIDASAAYIEEVLEKTVKEFPSIEKLEPFYYDLYTCIIDIDDVKKALSSIYSVTKLVMRVRRESLVKMKELKFSNGADKVAKKITHQYIGRVSSLIDGLKGPIDRYNDNVRKLKELPSIDSKNDTYILAGFPNVGKSTLLSKVTESKPEVAAYPFTTKGLNVGYFQRKYMPVQVIDTPGLLDRPLHARNKIELKAIAALQHLKGTVLFVVDPLDDLEIQRNLLEEMKKLFTTQGFIVVINKTDIANPKQIEDAKEKFADHFTILEGKGLDALKTELTKK